MAEERAEGGEPLGKDEHRAPIVTVFGAGIAGLTVAHELVERGFDVRVIEPTPSEDVEYECEVGGIARNQMGRIRADLALLHQVPAVSLLLDESVELSPDDCLFAEWRTRITAHLDRVAAEGREGIKREIAERLRALRSLPFQPVERRYGTPQRIHYSRQGAVPKASPPPQQRSKATGNWASFLGLQDDHGTVNKKKLEAVLEQLVAAWNDYSKWTEKLDRTANPGQSPLPPEVLRPESLLVTIRGHADGDGTEQENRELSKEWAECVKRLLVHWWMQRPKDPEHPPPSDIDAVFCVEAIGSAEPLGDQTVEKNRQRSNRVEFRIVERLMPGEHGYRYFPAFYRNLFDTMRRTPQLGPEDRETGGSVYDHLVPTPEVGIGFAAPSPHIHHLPRRRARSFKELRSIAQTYLGDMKVTEHDLLLYQVQLLKFLTTCAERRRREYESLSWFDFLCGRAPGDEACPYSDRARHYLMEIPRALVAMSADETDARTHGVMTAQLLLADLGDGETADMTLNGPSQIWLRSWKRYLKRQGVSFFTGRIAGLKLDDDELIPVFDAPPVPEERRRLGNAAKDPSDFYVLALPLAAAAGLVKNCDEGLLGDPGGSDLARLRRFADDTGVGQDPVRDPQTGKPSDPDYPCRDLAGVQFFFPKAIRVGEGHIYYADAEWGLSSISQLPYWRERMGRGKPFLGQVTVDLGNFYKEGRRDTARGKTAWNSTAKEIAQATWEQVVEVLPEPRRKFLPKPVFYSIDRGLEFGPEGAISRNLTPFLINLPGQWRTRPGFIPEGGRHAYADDECAGRPPLAPREIMYRVSCRRWVLAGSYMPTYTRLTTMESANESGRHAVNAILHALIECEEENAYNSAGKSFGDFCRVWNPEEHEFDDLEPLKRLDAALLAEGLPHFMDILKVFEHAKRGASAHNLLSLLDRARSVFEEETGMVRRGVQDALGLGAQAFGSQLRELFAQLYPGGGQQGY